MKIDGGCHCGRITYEAEVDLDKIFICHCTDCQSLSGSAYRTVARTVEDGFTLLSGKPKIYVKISDSGSQREQCFCGDCGSPIYATSVGNGPRVYGIRLGTANQRDLLRPKRQYWFKSAHKWVTELAGIPHVETQ